MLVTFEGSEGAGKTTQIGKLAAALRAIGRDPIVTREPGGTPFGEQVRNLLLGSKGISRMTETLLFNAARSQLCNDVILPALDRGRDVICDRFTASTLAYQGYAGGVPLWDLHSIHAIVTRFCQPDLIVLLDIDPLMGLKRKIKDDPLEWNRFEEESLRFHLEVQRGYHEMAQDEPGKWLVVDATLDPDTIHTLILNRYHHGTDRP